MDDQRAPPGTCATADHRVELRAAADSVRGGEHGGSGAEIDALRRPAACGPCHGAQRGSPDRRGCASAGGSRASCAGVGCSAGRCACSREGSRSVSAEVSRRRIRGHTTHADAARPPNGTRWRQAGSNPTPRRDRSRPAVSRGRHAGRFGRFGANLWRTGCRAVPAVVSVRATGACCRSAGHCPGDTPGHITGAVDVRLRTPVDNSVDDDSTGGEVQ